MCLDAGFKLPQIKFIWQASLLADLDTKLRECCSYSLIAAMEGIQALLDKCPGLSIWAAAADSDLSARGQSRHSLQRFLTQCLRRLHLAW